MPKKKKERKISMLVDGKPMEIPKEDIPKDVASLLQKLLEKREPFILVIMPLREKGYLLSSPEVVLSSPFDVLLLEAKTQHSIIDLFDEIILLRSKIREQYEKPVYVS